MAGGLFEELTDTLHLLGQKKKTYRVMGKHELDVIQLEQLSHCAVVGGEFAEEGEGGLENGLMVAPVAQVGQHLGNKEAEDCLLISNTHQRLEFLVHLQEIWRG